jgi:hypothetical protein
MFNEETPPPSKNKTRLTKTSKKDGFVAAVKVIDTGVAVQELSPIGQSPAVEGLNYLSMSLNCYSTIQDFLMQSLQDEDDNRDT